MTDQQEGTNGVIWWFDDFDESADSFDRNSHRFLSNFYQGFPIFIDGVEFPTGEHAFQAYKAINSQYPDNFATIARAKSPGHAKSLGRSITLRPDWEQVKFDVMATVVRAKFTMSRPEGEMLLSTGDAYLVEGTHWGDRVWGVDLRSGDNPWRYAKSPGRNWLGTLLMARRAELRASDKHGIPICETGDHNYLFSVEPS